MRIQTLACHFLITLTGCLSVLPAQANLSCFNVFARSLNQLVPNKLAIGKHTPGQLDFGDLAVEIKRVERRYENGVEKVGIKDPKSKIVVTRNRTGVRYIVVDKHHTMLGHSRDIDARSGELKGQDQQIRTEVLEIIDQPSWTDAQLADYLIQNNRMQVPDDYVIHRDWSFARDWPRTIYEMTDNPFRSLMKLVFARRGLRGKYFDSFSQFAVMNLAVQLGYKVPEVIDFSEAQVIELDRFVFSQPIIVKSMLESMPAANKPLVKAGKDEVAAYYAAKGLGLLLLMNLQE